MAILWSKDVWQPDIPRGRYKELCTRGHAMTDDNLYFGTAVRRDRTYAVRRCKACKRALVAEKYKRDKKA